jgi:hypothetical protein
MKRALFAPVREATLVALERAFSTLFDRPCLRATGAGALLEVGISPAPLGRSIVDEDEGMLSVAALRELGWPLDEDEEDGDGEVEPFRLLPWLGTISAHEINDMLSPDGVERAPELLLEPEAATTLTDRQCSGQWALSAGRWALLSLHLSGGDAYHPRESGSALLGLRQLEAEDAARIAVVVLPFGDRWRSAMLSLLGLDEAELAGATSGSVSCRLEYL